MPYTKVFPLDLSLDHTGPIAGSAYNCALLLEVLAGPDGLDRHQYANRSGEAYTEALTGDADSQCVGAATGA